MSAKERIGWQYQYHAKEVGKLGQIEAVLSELGLLDIDMYVSFDTAHYVGNSTAGGPIVRLEPQHMMNGIDIVMVPDVDRAILAGDGSDPDKKIAPLVPEMRLVETTPTLGQAAKVLMAKVGKLQKDFDEKANEIVLWAEYKGVRVELRDRTPETCTVETVEEEVTVPAVPEHTEIRKRYKLVGDCEPILTGGRE